MSVHCRAWFALALLLMLPGHAAWAQGTRTIKIVVPYAPGSGPDILGRLLLELKTGIHHVGHSSISIPSGSGNLRYCSLNRAWGSPASIRWSAVRFVAVSMTDW